MLWEIGVIILGHVIFMSSPYFLQQTLFVLHCRYFYGAIILMSLFSCRYFSVAILLVATHSVVCGHHTSSPNSTSCLKMDSSRLFGLYLAT